MIQYAQAFVIFSRVFTRITCLERTVDRIHNEFVNNRYEEEIVWINITKQIRARGVNCVLKPYLHEATTRVSQFVKMAAAVRNLSISLAGSLASSQKVIHCPGNYFGKPAQRARA